MYKLKDESTSLFLNTECALLVCEQDAGLFDELKANILIGFYKDRDGVVFNKVFVEG